MRHDPSLGSALEAQYPQEYRNALRLASVPALMYQPFATTSDPEGAQVGFLSSRARNKWAITGNRCGKTLTALIENWYDCMLLDPITGGPSRKFFEPIGMWVVTDTEETSIDIIERTFAEQCLGLDEGGMGWQLVDDKVSYSRKGGFSDHMVRFYNGSWIRFKFSTQKRRTFQGEALNKAHLDEEQPPDIYSEVRTRLIDQHGYFIGTMTPIYEKSKGVSWVYEDLYIQKEAKNLEFHHWTLWDNPYITAEAKKELMSEWQEDEIEARVYGMFVPMGVKLAFSGDLIRKQELTCETPEEATLGLTPDGKVELV